MLHANEWGRREPPHFPAPAIGLSRTLNIVQVASRSRRRASKLRRDTPPQFAAVLGRAARKLNIVQVCLWWAAGTSALYVDCPIERAHRDIHTVTQHVILAQMWLQEAGRVRLGLKPSNPFF
jgi:hypothetical protein